MKQIVEYLISKRHNKVKPINDDDFKEFIEKHIGSLYKLSINNFIDNGFKELENAYKTTIYELIIELCEDKGYHIIFSTSIQKANTKSYYEEGTIEFSSVLAGCDITIWNFKNSSALNINFIKPDMISISKLNRKNLFEYAHHLNNWNGKELIKSFTTTNHLNISKFASTIFDNI